MTPGSHWMDIAHEEQVYWTLLWSLMAWRAAGLLESIGEFAVERRRGLVASWACRLTPHADQALVLLHLEGLAAELCEDLELPSPIIWWMARDAKAQVRVAFSAIPCDA
jgi:hypothetical protein